MIVDNTVKERNILAQSPTFSMSLGAKELFHTNFLGFLLESDHCDLDGVRRALRNALNFDVQEGEMSHCFVWREYNHLDLVLVPVREDTNNDQNEYLPADRALVVEAKLKSLPSQQQLDNYLTKPLKALYLDHDDWPNGNRIRLSTKNRKTVSTQRFYF